MLDDRFPGEPANKGWNRASIMFWSRKPYRSRIRREDLTLPKHLDGVRLLASCASGAAAITAFGVWMPLFFASIYVGVGMTTFAAVMAGAFVTLTVVLYVWVAREKRRESEPLSEP
jgi:preprotein translocase subunit SecG